MKYVFVMDKMWKIIEQNGCKFTSFQQVSYSLVSWCFENSKSSQQITAWINSAQDNIFIDESTILYRTDLMFKNAA